MVNSIIMPNTSKTYENRHIDFIKTIAEIGEPFNSSLLDDYNEYQENLSSYEISDTRECFLSILNKIGEDGCQILTDRIVNYIDDVSNIDTTIPSALLSQAESIGYPYKDKKTVEQLSRLTKCSPLIQNLVWATSTNIRNSKTILNRLNIVNDKDLLSPEISSCFDVAELQNTQVGTNISSILFSKVFDKHYLLLDKSDKVVDEISSQKSPSLIDFSWFVNAVFADDMNQNSIALNNFLNNAIDFGKYNKTIYAIVCYNYLYSQLYNNNKYNDSIGLTLSANNLTKMAKTYMPFLYKTNLFDPIQAAWSILYGTTTLSDYDERYHSLIGEFEKAFNEKLDSIAYDAVMKFIENDSLKSKNTNFVYRLNAQSFSYQQLIFDIINDAKTLFSVDLKNYFEDGHQEYLEDISKNLEFWKDNGFSYLDSESTSLFSKIKWNEYISDIVKAIFNLGTRIQTLREDIRLMTFRNSYKGTAAIIQFATIEYLKDCIEGLTINAKDEHYFNNPVDTEILDISSVIKNILDIVNSKDQRDIGIGEYWDYTEYFNRVDDSAKDKSTEADWANILDFKSYGSMSDEEIFKFYTNVLNIPKRIYLENVSDDLPQPDEPMSEFEKRLQNLKKFLQTIYNSGVFTQRTNNDYESIYSGNINETSNDSPWVAFKNKQFISKQIHPYIWNFTNYETSKLYKSSAVTTALQNTEHSLLNAYINKDYGNIVDQYRLSENFVDSTGYVTRYEHRDHENKEITQSYDGYVYPKFAYDLSELSSITDTDWNTIKQDWYVDQNLTLTKNAYDREYENLTAFFNDLNFKTSVKIDDPDQQTIKRFLKNYSIDKYETTYGVESYDNHRILYKENGYPFMRPLINHEWTDGTYRNLGMLFVNADDSIDTTISNVNWSTISDDKFPQIVVSEDGTHVLLRTAIDEIRSYEVTTHKNSFNEIEQALKLHTKISCDPLLFDSKYFNDSLIKSDDDAFYILIPHIEKSSSDDEISSFTNYLLYIPKSSQEKIKISKQSFTNAKDDMFGSGMFLNDGNKVIINTYYVDRTNNISTYRNATEISAIYCNDISSIGNHQTNFTNSESVDSSLDVLNQFVQMYSSIPYSAQNGTMLPLDISASMSDSLSAQPCIELSIAKIDELLENNNSFYTEISIEENGFFNEKLMTSSTLPFARAFNINSDAGFNPIYIGEKGKIILDNRKYQFDYMAKQGGAAFELLGPQTTINKTIESSEESDEIDESRYSRDDIAFERIHEFYSSLDELSAYATSYDISSGIEDLANRTGTYRYGYASLIEDENKKNDVYRIGYFPEPVVLDQISSTNGEDFVTNSNPLPEISSLSQLNSDDYKYNRFFIFIEGSNNVLYSLIPRKPTTYLQDITNGQNEFSEISTAINSSSISDKYSMEFENTYVIGRIEFFDKHVRIYGSIHELLNSSFYIVQIMSNGSGSNNNIETPNFMLSTIDLKSKASDISDYSIDHHMMIPEISYIGSYYDVSSAKHLEYVNLLSDRDISSGSLVFTLTDIDSDLMNQQFPDQKGYCNIESVTVEALNDYRRLKQMNNGTTFDVLNSDFKPWKIVDLNLKREGDESIIGYSTSNSSSSDSQYIIQPYKDPVKIKQNDSNKYTISFWRSGEKSTPKTNEVNLDYSLQERIKTTELSGDYLRPIYANKHDSLKNLLTSFEPKIMVQWYYDESATYPYPIKLRFNNALVEDSAFINENSGLEYRSLSLFKDSIELSPGESKYIDIVSPDHVKVGMTVFYNIPIMRAYITNVSDDKPKFIMTLLNEKINEEVSLESNNYALVFSSASKPDENNSNIVYVTCYVAPMISINQTTPPSITNAISLSELAFNFDVANIINRHELNDVENEIDKSLVDVKYVYPITKENKVSSTAVSYLNYSNELHQIRIAEPINSDDETGFVATDMKIDLNGMSSYTLKNALFTAHGDVIAYDTNKKQCPIAKIFGCSLDKIGPKYVLGVKPDSNSQNKILKVTQNSGRETAILVNPNSNIKGE